jgi:micrococcal nuclease
MKKLSLILLFLTLSILSFAESITGKVIAVSDGDTIKILVDKTTYKIRLNGVDCPEKNQDYGQKAKQFTSDLVYNKVVTADIKDKDRYGRYVADVLISGTTLNKELVRNGFAWHYKQYSKDKELAALEEQARASQVGLWADSNPTPPWDFRHGNKSSADSTTTKSVEKSEKIDNIVYITKTGKKYHRDGCRSLSRSKIEISLQDAKSQGYDACKICY